MAEPRIKGAEKAAYHPLNAINTSLTKTSRCPAQNTRVLIRIHSNTIPKALKRLTISTRRITMRITPVKMT